MISITGPVSVNHVGFAVPDIARFLEDNALLYGNFSRGPLIVNERQKVREMFITDGRTVIELLEPLGEDSPIQGFLRKNRSGGLIHIALDVDDVTQAVATCESQGALTVVAPTPDPAFDGRKIAFVVANGQVTELVERARSAKLDLPA